jgi:hypothetical protein
LREALSEVRGNENAKQSLVSLSIEAQQNAAKIQSDFANQYQQKAYNKAFDSLAKMQFSIKFIDDIKALEAELEDL